MFNHPLSLHRCMEDFASLGTFKKYPKELKFEGRHKLKVRPQHESFIFFLVCHKVLNAVQVFGGRGSDLFHSPFFLE